MPFTSSACSPSSAPARLAILPFTCSSSFSRRLEFSRTCSSLVASLPRSDFSSRASSANCASSSSTRASAPSPVTASTRRMPAAIPVSAMSLNRPMSPARATCVPPHNSTEKSPPIFNTRTCSSYFSPNRDMAPDFNASSSGIRRISVSMFSSILRLTSRSISNNCCSETGSGWEKSNRNRSGATREPCWVTCSPSTSRNAACNRCVAEWLRTVLMRVAGSTRASASCPVCRLPRLTLPM